MAQEKKIPRERFIDVAAKAAQRRGFQVEASSARPARLTLLKDGQRFKAGVRTIQQGEERFGFDPTSDGRFLTLEDVEWMLFVGLRETSPWHFWVAAIPAEIVRRIYTEKWQERCRTHSRIRPDSPVFAYFGPAPTGAPSYRTIGANFGQHAIWREEVNYRVRLDERNSSEAAAERRRDPAFLAGGLEDRLRHVAEAAQGLPENVTIEVHIRLWP